MDRRTHLLIDCISHLPHSYSGITIRSFDFPDPPPENASYIRMIYAKKKNNIFLTFPLNKNFFFCFEEKEELRVVLSTYTY
jgi:hypothetical protein